ncbi:MAG: hypothetical protein NVSMB56_13170 [Pyrinomonadaceae bacterium]
MKVMPTRIAKIIKSNSHVDYVGRVIDALDADDAPNSNEYGFAQFVSIPVEGEGASEIIGVVYDTQLANPEYGQFGPRLSPRDQLAVLSPDYLNEQGVLLGILLLGWHDDGGAKVHHGVPRRVIPVGQDVYGLSDEATHNFHLSGDGRLRLHYFSQVLAHAGLASVSLIEAILEQLEVFCAEDERQRLCVLKKSLVWQRTLGSVRL